MSAALRVGTSGWSYADWRGVVYPQDAPRGFRELGYLARFFDTVEINTTFYRPPSPRYCEQWLGDVAGRLGFRFTLKLWQRFTHEQPDWGEVETRQFSDAIKPLVEAGRVGAVLVQYPWSFRRTRENAGAVKRVTDAFAALPLAVEFRHASWDTEEVRDWLRRHTVGWCNIDQPEARDAITGTDHVTGRVGYFRFHGRNRAAWFSKDAGRDERYNYLYDGKELHPWAARIRDACARAEEVYVMANNHFRGQAPVNALQMRALLSGEKVEVPDALIEYYPQLREIAR